MAQINSSSSNTYDPSVGIADLYFSVRTYNRLRKMKIDNLDQIARTTPREFLIVEGFGRKCLHEIAEILEQFYSELDAKRLISFANAVELWRPHFAHPERVPTVAYDPTYKDTNSPVAEPEPITPFDPTDNSQAQLLIRDLTLSVRAENVLKNAGVKTLNDLAQVSPRSLAKAENCGRKTLMELGNLLKEYFASLPPSAMVFYRETRATWLTYANSIVLTGDIASLPTLPNHLRAHTVAEIFEGTFKELGDRKASILAKRMGLSDGQPRKTLDAIGREHHLTRERVRQIVKAGLKLLLRKVKTHRPDVYREIRKLLREKTVVTLEEMQSAIPDLGDSTPFDPKACLRLLLLTNRAEAHRLDPVGNVWASKEITPAFNTKVLRAAQAILDGIPMSCRQASVEVARSLRQFDDKQIEIIQKLLLNSSDQFKIEMSDAGEILHPARQNNLDRRRAFIYAYIREQGVPVRIRELLSALQDSEPELIPDSPSRRSSIQTVDNGLARDDRFAWAGSGTWGLREWGYSSRGQSIGAAALEIIRASSVSLSTAQIIKELSHLYRVTPSGVSVALKALEGSAIERDSEGLWRLS